MRGALVALASLLWVVTFGCGGSASVAETSVTSSDVGSTGDADISIPDEHRLQPAEVTLLEAGAPEGASPLRFHTEVGDTEAMVMTQNITMAVTMGGQSAPPMAMPAFHTHLRMRTTHVDADGAMRREFEVTDLRVDEGHPLSARLQAELDPLRQLRGWDVIDARGRMVATAYDIPENASPQLRRSLERTQDMMRQLSPPLPEEPVGVGARWRSVSRIEATMSMTQSTIYTLEERDGERIRLRIEVEQTADPQQVASDQPGVRVDLVSLAGTARGVSSLRLNAMAPQYEGTASIRLDMKTQAEGQPEQPFLMEMDLSFRIAPN